MNKKDKTYQNFSQPDPEHIISDWETVKVITHPLRMRIMEALSHEPRTVKDVAAQVEMAATKLYYHVNLLEQHDLIRVVDSHVVSGIIEKFYQVAAYGFQLDRDLLPGGSNEHREAAQGLFDSIFDSTRQDVMAAVRTGEVSFRADSEPQQRILMARHVLRIPQERVAEYYDKLEAFLQEFADSEHLESAPSDPVFGLTVIMHPSSLNTADLEDTNHEQPPPTADP